MVPVLLACLAREESGSPLPALRKAGVAGVMGGIALVVAMGGTILAFQTTTIANAAFLLAASPFLAAILGRLILGEAVAPRTWGAIALALVGIFLMVREGLAAGALVGNVSALIAALGFAGFSVSLRWRRVESSLPPTILGAGFAVVAGVLATVQLGQPLVIPHADLMWCVLMGIVTMSGGMVLYTMGSRVVPSAELTLLSNTEILLAPLWVWLVRGETASEGTLLGGAVVLAAILFNASAGARRMALA
jgi:drug/metabolite transporter (DMT)-like permease